MTDVEHRLRRLEVAMLHAGNVVLHSRRKSGMPNPETERDEAALEALLAEIHTDLAPKAQHS